ncbi:MAG: N-acetylmuramoyl-L-alanine amidase [Parcubacteria group bacterium]|nr:N-acetylmuramoyl-L-alanine amidase [Parcubacteria group bacterium]
MRPLATYFSLLLVFLSINLVGCRETDTKIKATEVERQKTAVLALRNTVPKDTSLAGYYFVLDPGHGDDDPGAIRDFKGKDGVVHSVSESALTLDMARRLAWYLRARGASGVYFTLGPDEVVNAEDDRYAYWPPQEPPSILKELIVLLPASRYAYWPLEIALTPRTEVANQKVKTHGKKKVIFISIHVDSTNPSVQGMRVYSYYGVRTILGEHIARNAKKKGVARTKKIGPLEIPFFSTMHAGFIVMNPRLNMAGEKILIETTNIRNDNDFKKLCTADGRESIAHVIGEGIIYYRQAQKK